MIELLILIICISFFAFVTAAMTYFLNFCLGDIHQGTAAKGRIFSSVGAYILRKFYEHEKKEDQRIMDLCDLDELKYKRRRLNKWKALGACPPCSNVYMSFFVYPFTIYFLEMNLVQILLFWIPFVVISNFIVRKSI